jgi:tetratricopeptide (TPR) repeat protein
MQQLTIRHAASGEQRLFTVERLRTGGVKVAPPVEVADPERWAIAGSSAKLLPELAWYLESYLDYPFGPNEERAERVIQALNAWGRGAFEALFGEGQGRDFYRDAIRDGHDALDLVIASDDPEALGWPWEALHDPLVGDLAHHCRIERHLTRIEDPPPPHPKLSREQIGILLITARPYEDDVSYRSISRPLVNLVRSAKLPVSVKLLRPPTFAQLRAELTANPHMHHIVHFDGHGGFGSGERSNARFRSPQGHLAFEKEDGSEDLVPAELLSQLLREHRIQIAVLNACQSGTLGPGSDDPFGSVATSLLRAGVRSVLAMGYSLYVSAAKQFLPAFYQRLFQTGNVSEATRAGRQAMLAKPERRPGFSLDDWLVPILYQQEPLALDFQDLPYAADNSDAAAIPEQARFDPTENPHGLIGRDSAILALERATRRKPAGLLIHGLGGVGKTTLARGFVEWLANTQGLPLPPIWISFSGVRFVDYVLNRLTEAVLGQDALAIPGHEKWGHVCAALKEQPRLIVWDNFESASGTAGDGDQSMSAKDRQQLKRWLEELHGGRSKVLITSRSDESWLGPTACFRVPLAGLVGEERQDLARAIVADQGVRLDPKDRKTADLIDLLEGHPMMMRAILPKLAMETPGALMRAVESYVPQADSIDDVERKLYATLRYVEEGFPIELRPLLIPIGLHDNCTSADLLAKIADSAGQTFNVEDAEKAMQLLEVAGLAQRLGSDLFRLHPALTRYLRARSPLIASDPDQLGEWQRAFVDVMAMLAQSITGNRLHEQRAALAIFGGSINAALRIAEADHWPISDFGALAQSLAVYALNQRNFPVARRYFEALTKRVEGLGMDQALASSYHQLGIIAQEERDLEAAKQWYQKSQALSEALGDEAALSRTFHQLGIVAQISGDLDVAESWYLKSLDGAEKLGDTEGMSTSYHQLGGIARLREELDSAERWYKKALDLNEAADDEVGAATTMHQLGVVALLRKDPGAAEQLFLSAAQIFERYNHEFNAAKSYHQLGLVVLGRDPLTAENWLVKALKASERVGDKDAWSTLILLGYAKLGQGDRPLAIAWFRRALETCERLGLEKQAERVRRMLDETTKE